MVLSFHPTVFYKAFAQERTPLPAKSLRIFTTRERTLFAMAPSGTSCVTTEATSPGSYDEPVLLSRSFITNSESKGQRLRPFF